MWLAIEACSGYYKYGNKFSSQFAWNISTSLALLALKKESAPWSSLFPSLMFTGVHSTKNCSDLGYDFWTNVPSSNFRSRGSLIEVSDTVAYVALFHIWHTFTVIMDAAGSCKIMIMSPSPQCKFTKHLITKSSNDHSSTHQMTNTTARTKSLTCIFLSLQPQAAIWLQPASEAPYYDTVPFPHPGLPPSPSTMITSPLPVTASHSELAIHHQEGHALCPAATQNRKTPTILKLQLILNPMHFIA